MGRLTVAKMGYAVHSRILRGDTNLGTFARQHSQHQPRPVAEALEAIDALPLPLPDLHAEEEYEKYLHCRHLRRQDKQ